MAYDDTHVLFITGSCGGRPGIHSRSYVRVYSPLTLISARGEDGSLTAGTGVRDNHLDELDFKSLLLPMAFEAAS